MDFLDFADVLFVPNSSIGKLCEDLNTIVGGLLVRYILSSKYNMRMAGKRYCYDH